MSTPSAKRRVGFLVESLGQSGGMSVVRQHARHLAAQDGWEPSMIVTGRNRDRVSDGEAGVPVMTLADADGDWDFLIATWWTTTESLWSLPAARRVVFMQGIEQRFYREEDWPDRIAAMTVMDLPVGYIVVSEYMVDLMDELRPDATVIHVPNGIDKATFVPSGQKRADGPLRVLLEGQPTLWFKGIEPALQAVHAMRHPATVTLAVHDTQDAERASMELEPDQIVSAADPAAMASLYNEHDVLLKLSRFEGFGLPVLEALHTGTPVVTTPYAGHDVLVDDGVNGFVVDFDDPVGTAAVLDSLAEDDELRMRLAEGAASSVHDWPSAAACAQQFEEALTTFAGRDAQSPDAALDALMKRRRASTELAREALRRERVALAHARAETDSHRQARDEAAATAEALDDELRALREEVETLRSRRSQRLANVASRFGRSIGRGR